MKNGMKHAWVRLSRFTRTPTAAKRDRGHWRLASVYAHVPLLSIPACESAGEMLSLWVALYFDVCNSPALACMNCVISRIVCVLRPVYLQRTSHCKHVGTHKASACDLEHPRCALREKFITHGYAYQLKPTLYLVCQQRCGRTFSYRLKTFCREEEEGRETVPVYTPRSTRHPWHRIQDMMV